MLKAGQTFIKTKVAMICTVNLHLYIFDLQNDIQILTQLHYLRKIPSVQWKPLKSIFEDISDMTESILPDGQHVSNDPVN